MIFITKKFNELTTHELYDIIQLRSEVFVVEQDCVYQDLDDKDKLAYHILGTLNNQIIAYARIFKSGDYFSEPSIGRIVVKNEFRKHKYGYQLVLYSIQFIENNFKKVILKFQHNLILLNSIIY